MRDHVEGLLVDVFDGLDLGIAVVDRAHRFLLINRALAAMNGRSVAEHAGRHVKEIVPELAVRFEPRLRQVFETGEAPPLELVGRDRVWETRYTPVRRGGEIVAVTAVVADATARKAAEAAQFKSEAQFRAICDASPIGIFLTDAVGGSLYSNPENLRQMGLTLEEAMGNGWQRAIHPDDFARVSEGFRAATQEGKTCATNARYLHAGGACVHVAVKARAIRDGETVLGYVGMVEDIGERLASEAALRESELRFRQLADHIDDVFWLAGMDRVHYASPAFERVFGRPVADVYADVWVILEAVHPEDRPRVKAMMESVERDDIEYRIILPDGAVRWIRDRSFPIRDDRGRTVRKAGIATDITRQKALETQLLQTQKLDSIGRLAGGIAHDFNNLLTVILTQARMAGRAFAAGRSGAEELGQIEEAASRAADLTRQLLMFARRQPSHPVPLDLTEVTSGIEKLLRRVIGPNVELVARLDPNIGIVRGDRAQLEQVLVNLAVNARDAMPEGGTLTIDTVDVTREEAGRAPGPYVLLRVSDTGHGIAEADRAHVFDPFFTTKRHAGGTGLGLASCYGIVQQHGGEIAVESAPGGGATFCVYLPRIDATEPVVRDGGPSVPRMFGSETVLLVEDDALLRRSTSATLREHGFTVVEASSGEEALERLGDHDVDIVVSDVLMRGVDGRELAERLERERPALPILLTSGYSEGVGRFPFLAKPYVPATLVRRVRELLDTRGLSASVLAPFSLRTSTMPSDLRILVVDDDVLVRRAVVRGLARSASVVGAATTDEALALLRAGERFDLVLLDLSMASVPSFLDEIDGVDPAQREHVYLHTGAYLSPRDARSELVGGRVLEKPASFDAILELARALRDQPSSPADPALTRTDCASRAAAE